MNRDTKTLALSAFLCTGVAVASYFTARAYLPKLWAFDVSLGLMVAVMAVGGLVAALSKDPKLPLIVVMAAAAPATGLCWAVSRATMNGWMLIAGCAILLVSLLVLLIKCQDLEESVPLTALAVVGMLEISPMIFFM